MHDKAAKYRRLRERFLYIAATADSRASVSETVRNKVAKDSFVALQGVNSLYEVFERSVARWPDNKCLGRRVADVWVWETYRVSSAQGKRCDDIRKRLGLTRLSSRHANPTSALHSAVSCKTTVHKRTSPS